MNLKVSATYQNKDVLGHCHKGSSSLSPLYLHLPVNSLLVKVADIEYNSKVAWIATPFKAELVDMQPQPWRANNWPLIPDQRLGAVDQQMTGIWRARSWVNNVVLLFHFQDWRWKGTINGINREWVNNGEKGLAINQGVWDLINLHIRSSTLQAKEC